VNIWDIFVAIVANDVLPGLTALAEHCATIVILVGADAFDGVGLLLLFVGGIDGKIGGGDSAGSDRKEIRRGMRV
jgi:hypothetical protein